MGKSDYTFIRSNKRRDILRRMTGCYYQPNGRREMKSFSLMAFPGVTFIDGPVIMETRMWEQCSVQCMIRVMVGKYYVCYVFRRLAKSRKWFKDCIGAGNHSRVNNNSDISVTYKTNRRGNVAYCRCVAILRIPIEEDMYLRR